VEYGQLIPTAEEPPFDGAPPVLAVDLDGTLIGVNSFPHFVRHLLVRLLRAGRLRAAARVASAVLSRKLLGRDHETLKAVIASTSEGLDTGAFSEAMLRRHLNPSVAELVRTWPGTSVLCTAAPESYARGFAAALGFDHVQGSVHTSAGFEDNSGERKAARLRRAGLGAVEVAVTDDPELDGPLLALARRRLLIIDGRLEALDCA
jgi:phosphoserine phosphatase